MPTDGIIDYTNLLNPSGNNKKNSDLAINFIPSKPKFKFAKDIFDFVENPEFIGEDLFPMQKEVLDTYYNTKDATDTRVYQELILISGMRSGKTKLAGMIGSYELHKLLEILESGQTFKEYFKPRGVEIGIGQQIYIVTIAAALDQAETTVFSALKAYLLFGPWFIKYNNFLKSQRELNMGKFEITYKNLIRIKAEDSNSQTLVGKTIHTLLFDEISRLDTSDSEIGKKSEKRNAQAVYQGISKGTMSFRRDRNIIVVSAPVYEDDFGMTSLMRSGSLNACEETRDIINTMAQKFPTKILSRLGYHSTSYAFNPSIDRDNDPLIQGIKDTSPLAYKRDVLALPPAGINSYFEDPKKIDACLTEYKEVMVTEQDYYFDETVTDGNGYNLTRTYVGKSPTTIKGNNLTRYFVSCDQAAKKDSFALAIGHGEWVQIYDEKTGEMKKKLRTVIDYVTCWKPDREKNIEVSFENVIQFIVKLKEYINIQTITFDQWNSTSLFQAMHKFGIQTKEISTGAGTAIWESLKGKINNGLVSFPIETQCVHVTLLIAELKKLQLIKGKTIDHPVHFSKDLGDAVARINYLVEESAQGTHASLNPIEKEKLLNSIGGDENIRSIVINNILPLMEKKAESVTGNGGFFFTAGRW